MIIETPTGQDGCCDEGDPRIKTTKISYDTNGNQLEIKEVVGDEEISMRKNLWDEENRLRAVDLNPDNDDHHNIAVYTYDASGQRVLRHIPTRVDVYSNATGPAQEERDITMIYPSGLITAKVITSEAESFDEFNFTKLKYTKHYYIGSERISSATDTDSFMGVFINGFYTSGFFPIEIVETSEAIVEAAGEALEGAYSSFGLDYTVPEPDTTYGLSGFGSINFFATQVGRYFFHPDHLGSSSYITNLAGVVSQHMEYLPFGELLVDEHLNSHNSLFKFNGKELDPETGNYYYGARYYDPKWSIFISVDPLAEQVPDWTPYRYGFNNPIKYIDPTGLWEVEIGEREVLNRKGEGTGKFEKYIYFVAQEGDDINSLAKETGLDIKQLKQGLGDIDITEGTKLDKLGISSVDKAIKSINKHLNLNSKASAKDKSNCWGTSLSVGLTGEVDLYNAAGTGTGAIGDPNVADRILQDRFEQTDSPKFGDIGRFAYKYGNIKSLENFKRWGYKLVTNGKESGGTSHYATFLLKNKQGTTYFFSKNGSGSKANWDINTDNQLMGYGNLTPIGTGSPYYTKKNN